MFEEYIKVVNDKLSGKAKEIMVKQINRYYSVCDMTIAPKKYNVGDEVILPRGTLIHGTYKNLEGLKDIVKHGLISSWFIDDGRNSKYASSVGVWNLNKDYKLKDYVDFYSGGTAYYYNIGEDNGEVEVIPYSLISSFLPHFIEKGYLVWKMDQTKEARFIPSLVQNRVQLAVIFNGDNKGIKELLKGDILDPKSVLDEDVKPFVHESYQEKFINERNNKDAFFTDRESAILFGIPSNFIEGIFVGRDYEKDENVLSEIKELLPNAYICNLDGKVIKA